MNKNTKKRIFVAMSGGVDSSVAATLLKQATPNNFKKLFGRQTPMGFRGYDVVGVHMRCWSPNGCNEEDAEDARRVAEVLDIPFYVFDFEKEYKERVVDYMIDGYKSGITPNPDVMCNREIKFGLFLEKALEMGADYIATGHYVRLLQRKNSTPSTRFTRPVPKSLRDRDPGPLGLGATRSLGLATLPFEEGERTDHAKVAAEVSASRIFSLCVAGDKNKDQSYFLWTLTQKQLKHCLFPIGNFLKSEVRRMAQKFKLPTASKKDSQGICFVGQVTLADFLKDYIKEKPGVVVNTLGEKIGEHKGAAFYTIGQRHGLVSGTWKRSVKSDKSAPFFVVEKNVKKNILVVSDEDEKELGVKEIRLTNVNLISDLRLQNKDYVLSVYARLRYRQPVIKANLICNLQSKIYNLEFDHPVKFVAPGQSAVFYDKKGTMLGGGIII